VNPERKKEKLKRIREAIAKEESVLSGAEMSIVKEYSAIMREDRNVRQGGFIGVVMEAEEGDLVRVMKEIKSQMRLLWAEAEKAKEAR
jgi:hypothetical protein